MKGMVFTYLLCYGGAVISLFNPFIGLLIYVCFAVLRPEALWDWAISEGNYSRIVAIALLAGWVLKGCGDWQFGRARPIVMALVGFWLWMALSAAVAAEPEVAWRSVESLSKIVLPFVVGMTLINSVRQLKQLAWVVFLSQGYVAYEFNLSYYQGFNRILLSFSGLDNNGIAIALVANTGLGFFLGLHAQRWWQKVLAFGFAACSGHAVLFSQSRGGVLGLIITGLSGFFLLPKQPKHFAVFALAVLLGIRLAGAQVQERFSTTFADAEERDGSAQGRLELWTNCWDVMLKHPLLGVGPEHWPIVATDYGWYRGKAAHSTWMQTGAELGFPGLGFLALFYIVCMIRLWPLARRRQTAADPWFADSARMVCASLIGFMVSAQFVSLWGVELPYYITLVGAGTLKVAMAPHAAGETGGVPSEEPQTPAPVLHRL